MSPDAHESRAKVQTDIAADHAALMTQAYGYVVVTFWQDRSGDGRKGSYDYQHHGDLNAALDTYREYQDGEFTRATAVGIFEARNGLPIGEAISPARLLQLMQETRAAA